jgi:hypothetical protein
VLRNSSFTAHRSAPNTSPRPPDTAGGGCRRAAYSDRLRFGFEAEGLAIEAGGGPAGYAQGELGWFVDEPTYTFPDGSRMRTRLTAVVRLEQGDWRIVHMHVSVGVPDEEVVALQQRWTS